MSRRNHPIDVGAPIADLENSPIISNSDEEQKLIDTEIPEEERMCYFSGECYTQGTYIKSGAVLLLCDRGTWVEVQNADEL